MAKKKRKKAPKKRGKKTKKKAAKVSASVDAAAVREYYEKHGWRPTLSKFGLSTTEASAIIKGKKSKAKKAKKKRGKKKTPKAAAPKKRGRKPGKKRGKKKAAKKKEVDAAAVIAYNEKHGWTKTLKKFKLGTKEASAILNGGKRKKKARKKTKKKRSKKRMNIEFGSGEGLKVNRSANADVLDWLLAYRKKNQKAGHMMTLDSVIIDLMGSVRGV